jgi:hypothetical protein
MTMLFSPPRLALTIATVLAALSFAAPASALETCCGPEEGPSWIFAPSTYTHDPMTGARVAQYARIEPVEPLPDQRAVTSGYRRTVTNIRGIDGSLDQSYQVQNWANGRGGLDAEWERVNDAWQQAYLTGSYYSTQNGAYGNGYGYGGWGGHGWGNGGWNGGPHGGWGGPGWNGSGGPGWNGPGGPQQGP